MDKIKLIAVNYLNTKPFIYGLFQSGLDKQLDIQKDIPAVCAEKLISGEVDIALIPVGALHELKEHFIVSDYCIGCDGPVQTVCLYSHIPIWEVKTVYLDTHSRTSKALAKILLKEHWNNSKVVYKPVIKAEEILLEESAAVLAIGDKTIGMDKKCRHTYDLGDAWKEMTGLPFIFAAWVANKKLDPEFIDQFNKALSLGLSQIDELTFILPETDKRFDLKTYFEKYISYDLDDKKKEALRLFLSKIDKTSRPEDAVQPIFA